MKEGFTIIEKIKISSTFDSLVAIEELVDTTCNTLGVTEDAYGNVLIGLELKSPNNVKLINKSLEK